MITKGKLYQHYLGVYQNRLPRMTVSEAGLRTLLPAQFPDLITRASGPEYGTNFTVRITGFGRVKFYFCAHYRTFRDVGDEDVRLCIDKAVDGRL